MDFNETKTENTPAASLPLGRLNFIAMGVAAVLIVAGFLLMLGSSSTPQEFNLIYI